MIFTAQPETRIPARERRRARFARPTPPTPPCAKAPAGGIGQQGPCRRGSSCMNW